MRQVWHRLSHSRCCAVPNFPVSPTLIDQLGHISPDLNIVVHTNGFVITYICHELHSLNLSFARADMPLSTGQQDQTSGDSSIQPAVCTSYLSVNCL